MSLSDLLIIQVLDTILCEIRKLNARILIVKIVAAIGIKILRQYLVFCENIYRED
jgi:hypothetical protein